jgi:dihydropyrimidine dehydrogenase (NAD+) subunit PreT
MESLHVFGASGIFGHSIGIWAAVLMAFNLLYFARKEYRVFSRFGNIHSWMYFHQFSGLLAAVVILLHTALIMHNAFALALYISLGLLLLTGIIGRYLYVMVPTDPRGRPLTHEALVDLSDRMKEQYSDLFGQLDATIEVSKVLDRGYQPNHSFAMLLLRLFTIWPYRLFQLSGIFRRAHRQLAEKEAFAAFKHYGTEMARLHLQLEIAWRIKRLLSLWRHGHAILAMLTVALVTIHVIIEIEVGYLP